MTYTAARHAVIGMTKNAASPYGKQKIRCNTLASASVQTEFPASMDIVDKFGMGAVTRRVNLILE